MFFSQKWLQRVLGVLWLIDGIFQLQPQMFTLQMTNRVMVPSMMSQPGPIFNSLYWIIMTAAQHVVLVNLLIALIQIGLGVLLLSGRWVKGAVIVSIVWALIVWYAGEGLGMLLTGQASVLTGAPGAVLLYLLLGLLVYPRKSSSIACSGSSWNGVLSPALLRWILAGFWIFAALLQVQPYWWQSGRHWGQISQLFADLTGQGGLNNWLVDPVLQKLSAATVTLEIPLNIILIEVFLALGIGLALVKRDQLRPWLVCSIVLSVLIWWMTQAFGMIFTGFTTDFNSGLLLILIALVCWPKAVRARTQEVKQAEGSVSSAQIA